VFALENGKELRFVDPRRFGWVGTGTRGAEKDLEELKILGVDPLMPEFTADRLHELTQSSRRPMKSFLLDQSKIAGLGNIYVAEALFGAAIHPSLPADKLSRARTRALRDSIVDVLERALAHRGTTLRDYTDGEGRAGQNQFQLHVYDRAGQPCPRCGRKIRRVVDQGRSTFFCAGCQKR
jgi:formamidopyrimidine-DNA glycosylase